MTSTATAEEPVKLWGNRDYRWWFAADTSYQLSDSVVGFIIPLLVISVTHSPGFASTLSSVFLVISTFVGILGGVVQDRYDRRRLLGLNGLSAAFLLLGCAGLIYVFGLRVEIIVGFAVLYSIRKGLLGGASNSMLRGVVSDEQLPKASSANIARDSTLNIVGGPIGGFLLGINHFIALVVSSILCIFSSLFGRGIKNYWKAESEAGEAKASFRTAFRGLWWTLSNKFQRRFALTAAIAAGAGNAFILLTVLQVSSTTSSTVKAGMINSIAAAGIFCGALCATWLINRVRSGLLVTIMFATMSTGLIIAALTPIIWVKLVFIPLALFPLPAASAVLLSFFSILVSKENLGRWMAGDSLVTYLTLAAITFVSGWVMNAWGYRVASLGIAGLLLISAISALTFKPLVTLPKPDGWAAHVEKHSIPQL